MDIRQHLYLILMILKITMEIFIFTQAFPMVGAARKIIVKK